MKLTPWILVNVLGIIVTLTTVAVMMSRNADYALTFSGMAIGGFLSAFLWSISAFGATNLTKTTDCCIFQISSGFTALAFVGIAFAALSVLAGIIGVLKLLRPTTQSAEDFQVGQP